MAIRVRNIKKSSDLKRFEIPLTIASASDGWKNQVIVPFRSKLVSIMVGATAAACQTVWTITNVTRSAALATGITAAGLAAKGSVSELVINSDKVISQGSLLDTNVSCTAMALGYAKLIFEKEGNFDGDK